ncbi:MAG: glycosyltransferase family 2 protein [Selenomonas sp.]|nr:glycosyltransferase family 2 protein [Selenomonas sp.]
MKKIVLVSMVKNEADIIESFVRHSLTYADELIIADHQSSDATWDILQKLRDEGLPLTLHRLYRVELAHREVMNRLTREAITKHGAELVLPFDADEFLVNDENDFSCRQVLEILDPAVLYCLHWRRYEPLFPEKDRDQFLLSRPCRREKEFSNGQKTIVGAQGYIHGRPYELIQGAHSGEYLDDGSGVPMTMVPFLHTAHFHWRSQDQYATKVATSWLNNVSKYTVHTITAAYLKRYFDGLRSHEAIMQEDELKESETYDLSPYVQKQELRYTSSAPADIIGNVMAASERIAEQLAETKVLLRHKIVSVILVWTGQEDASWQHMLQDAWEQTYPYREIFVLCMAEGKPEVAESSIADEITWIPAVEEGWSHILEDRVHGDYVQWILPGESMTPDKVQRMTSFLEMQDWEYSAAFASGSDGMDAAWQMEDAYPIQEPLQSESPADVLKHFLQNGRYPVGGLSAGIFRRRFLSSVHWLESCFIDGRPMVFVMWCELLRAIARSEGNSGLVGILRADFCKGHPVTKDAFLWHQLQWASLLQTGQGTTQSIQTGWKNFLVQGERILQEEPSWKSSPFYPEYHRLLEQACRS